MPLVNYLQSIEVIPILNLSINFILKVIALLLRTVPFRFIVAHSNPIFVYSRIRPVIPSLVASRTSTLSLYRG